VTASNPVSSLPQGSQTLQTLNATALRDGDSVQAITQAQGWILSSPTGGTPVPRCRQSSPAEGRLKPELRISHSLPQVFVNFLTPVARALEPSNGSGTSGSCLTSSEASISTLLFPGH